VEWVQRLAGESQWLKSQARCAAHCHNTLVAVHDAGACADLKSGSAAIGCVFNIEKELPD